MYQITAKGPRADIEAAWDHLAWSDPSPATAVDAKEDSRVSWRLDAYSDDLEGAQDCAEMILSVAPGLNPVVNELPDRDWVTLSLEGLPPVEAGRFIVAGSHVLTQTTPGKTGILIEAGPAFGTGHHGTTLGCLIALEYVLKKTTPRSVLDVGTGSGVLAIAAVKTGTQRAIGTEIDAQSVRVASENAAKNKIGNRFKTYETGGGMNAIIQRAAPFELVFANILARPLTRLAPKLVPLIAPGGSIILSGLLTHQVPLVRAAYANRGLSLIKHIRKDGWSTLLMTRKVTSAPA